MKVGVLYPRSKVYPDITTDFTNGLKSYLKKEQLHESIHLTLEGIGFGGAEKEVYEKVEKLMVIDEVDVVVAYIDEKVIGILQPLLQSTGKLLLVVGSGANYPESWTAQPTVLRLTLQDAFLCYLSGKLALQQKDQTALVATSFYECGYLHLAMMVNGFNSGGGQVVYNYVNKQQGEEPFQIDELLAYLNSGNATTNLLCVLGSTTASSFYQQLNERDDADKLHLFVSPMMLEPAATEKLNGSAVSIEGYLPWMATAGDSSNLVFKEAYHTQTKKEASLFSLLGWETGMVLKQVFTCGEEKYQDGASIPPLLHGVSMDGPRGEIKLDPATHYFTAPFFKYSSQKNNTEPVAFSAAAAWEEYTQQPTGGVHSGWTNTYLCY
jgi:branched-chain amino acid transport system substrate-binding protein